MIQEKKQPLLSICIPTYNRAKFLSVSLHKILKNSNNEVEVIVSNNDSKDNTQEEIKKLKDDYPNLKAYCNLENIGANKNFFKLIDEYAIGKFVWLIGDDDFLDDGLVDVIVSILKINENRIKYVGLNFRIKPNLNSIQKSNYKIFDPNNLSISYVSFNKVLELQVSSANILATFITCNIFLRNIFSDFNKSIFCHDPFTDYKSLFPHSYIIASSIHPKDLCIFIHEPVLSICQHNKSWDNKLPKIMLYYIPQLYLFYKKKGFRFKKVKKVIKNTNMYLFFNPKISFKLKLHYILFFLTKI